MAFKITIGLAALQEKGRHTATIDGHKLLLIWHQDKVHAVQSQCPHLKLPLSKGTVTEHCTIICPFHKSEFDLDSGETTCWSPWPPVLGTVLGKISKEKTLKIYKTKIENGQVMVDLA